MAESGGLQWISTDKLKRLVAGQKPEQIQQLTVTNSFLPHNPEALADLSALANLTSLTLMSFTVDTRIIEVIASIGSLKSLKIAECKIDRESAEALASLINLTCLDLCLMEIRDDGATAIARLKNLTSLDLSYNQISDRGAESIGDANQSFANLEQLNLSGNNIGPGGAKAIAKLKHLKWLNLSWNNIGNTGAEAIAEFNHLEWLGISNNGIGDAGVQTIADKLRNLTSLDMAENGIGDVGAQAISDKLPDLTSLNVASNSIREKGAKEIATLRKLTFLDISGNPIGTGGARDLGTAPNLTSLSIRGISNDQAFALLDVLSDAPNAKRLKTLDITEGLKLKYPLKGDLLKDKDAQEILAAYRVYRRANPKTEVSSPPTIRERQKTARHTERKPLHWTIEHAAKVAIGEIVKKLVLLVLLVAAGILILIGTYSETLWEKALCTYSSDPPADTCPPSKADLD